MTSTSVKDVGMLTNGFANMVSGAGGTAKADSFQSVFKQQTNRTEKEQNNESVYGRMAADKNTAGVKVQHTQRKADGLKQKDAATEHESNLDEDDWSEKATAISDISMQFLLSVADAFDISVEELQTQMNHLGINPTDLFNQDSLGQLLMAVGQETDSLSLLTNEDLYQSFQDAMKAKEAFIEELSDRLKMTPEQTEALLKEFDEAKLTPAELEGYETVNGLTEETDKDPLELVDEMAGISEDAYAEDSENNLQANMSGKSEMQHHESKENKGSEQVHGNLVLEQMKADGSVEMVEQPFEMTQMSDPDTENIMRQIMDYMKVQIKPDMSQMEMQLHPASLGTLQVQVANKGGVLTAQFVTQNEAVKNVLETQMVQLKENFEQQGMKVEAIEVSVQTNNFDRNLSQEQNKGQEPGAQKGRTRRIRLNANEVDFSLDQLNEEEQMAAKMMEANGTTVDFTA